MEYTSIGESCSVVSGGTPSRSKNEYWENGNIPWIKIGNIKSKYVNEYDELITEQGLNNSSAKLLEKGTILYTIFATLGEVGILDIEACTNQAIAGINITDPRITIDYLYYYLKSKKDYVNNIGRGVAQNNINLTTLKNFEIPLIDVDKQLNIVEILEKVERMICLKEKKIDDLDLLIKARFVEMFGTISEEVPLSYYIASLNAGKSLASEEENSDKVLKTGAVTYDYFDATQIKNLPINYAPQESHRVKAGDIIISRMNTAELVGATAYVWKVPEHVFLPDRLWRADVKETATPIFVWQMLIQSSTKKSIRRIASGTSGSMKNISKSRLLGINVVKAPINLQEQFADFVVQVDKSKYDDMYIRD